MERDPSGTIRVDGRRRGDPLSLERYGEGLGDAVIMAADTVLARAARTLIGN